MTRRRAARTAGAVLAGLAALGAGGGVWLRGRLLASLPQLDGERAVAGLAAPVVVERDALGVPTLRGSNRLDVARATGFVHAQDRFFQMDLTRRKAAGELSELVGPAALTLDREVRVHRFRAVARQALAQTSAGERAWLEAYAEGVNAGLASLGAPPPEYLALRVDPAPWRPEDTILVVEAMFLVLQDEGGRRESDLGVMHDVLPRQLFEFLVPEGTEWDAPLVGGPRAEPEVPGPDVLDLRKTRPSPRPEASLPPELEPALGSNNWAVAGRLTAHGGALLANDMHLDITVPNTWYRASLVLPGETPGEERRITGVTLPGAPAVVVGSNGHVAWGFTNSFGDWNDLVVIEPDPDDKDAYLTPDGPRKYEHVQERIGVKGAPDQALDVVETIWGPLIDTDHLGRARALRWTAHDARALDPALDRLESARTLDEALALANRVGAPAQNFVCADASGRIGWTILGIMPRRVGFDGRLPGSWADGTRRWDGWLSPEEYPRVVDPPEGLLWTANARTVDGEMLARLGDGGFDLGARARQIRDDLRAVEKPAERDMLKIQLDDRALFLSRWHDLLLRTLTPEAIARAPRRAELRKLVEGWGGRATIDSAGYRLVRAFRGLVLGRALGPLTAACRKADPRFRFSRFFQSEGPLWALVSERPAHLLDPAYATWDDLLLSAADEASDTLTRDGSALAQHTWGERNSPEIAHPLSRALPLLSRWLDMPRVPIRGDSNMPRVQNGDEGASERMVVSPGREAEGIFHMPCGQSGHPLSPHYGDGHLAWLHGEATPFLPGRPLHRLRLVPGPAGAR